MATRLYIGTISPDETEDYNSFPENGINFIWIADNQVLLVSEEDGSHIWWLLDINKLTCRIIYDSGSLPKELNHLNTIPGTDIIPPESARDAINSYVTAHAPGLPIEVRMEQKRLPVLHRVPNTIYDLNDMSSEIIAVSLWRLEWFATQTNREEGPTQRIDCLQNPSIWTIHIADKILEGIISYLEPYVIYDIKNERYVILVQNYECNIDIHEVTIE